MEQNIPECSDNYSLPPYSADRQHGQYNRKVRSRKEGTDTRFEAKKTQVNVIHKTTDPESSENTQRDKCPKSAPLSAFCPPEENQRQ